MPPDVDVPQPDEKSIITYVSSLYDAMPRVPDVQDGVKANVSAGAGLRPRAAGRHPAPRLPSVPQELQLRWQEYYEVVTLLLQWIRHHTVLFEERRFPASYEEIEVRELGQGGLQAAGPRAFTVGSQWPGLGVRGDPVQGDEGRQRSRSRCPPLGTNSSALPSGAARRPRSHARLAAAYQCRAAGEG